MRIVIIGSPGAGKTTLAKSIATALAIPFVELDALHWDPGWTAMSVTDPDEFARRVATSTAGDAWVVDGNYASVRDLVWPLATHLIWLDYDRPLIMARVIRRTLARLVFRTALWSGNKERLRDVLRPSHPIAWAWRTWHGRSAGLEALLAEEAHSHLVVYRLRRPTEAAAITRTLVAQSVPGVQSLAGPPARRSNPRPTYYGGGGGGPPPYPGGGGGGAP